MLRAVTILVNMSVLAICLCLGLYLVTRSPRSKPAWLAALALWALTALFFNNAHSVDEPLSGLLPWLRRVSLFALPFWTHMTTLLYAVETDRERRSWLDRLNQLGVPIAYLGVTGMVVAELASSDRASSIFTAQALMLSDWTAGVFSPVAGGFLILVGILALVNLFHGWLASSSPELKGQFTFLIMTSILAAVGILYIALGVWLGIPLPAVPGDLIIGISVIMLGYGVARYNALLEGRVIKRDLIYVAVAISSLTLIVLGIAELLHRIDHHFSTLTQMLIAVIAVSALMLYDGIRSTVDRLFFESRYRQLRANLRLLARDAGSGHTIDEQLEAVLNALGRELGIRSGLVAIRQDKRLLVRASRHALPPGTELPEDTATSAETIELDAESSPLAVPSVLVPFDDGCDKLGALILGRATGDRSLDEEEVALAEEAADQMASLMLAARQQDENARRINEMVIEFRQRERALQQELATMVAERSQPAPVPLEDVDEKEFVSLVEEALRRLHDYPYLGDHVLAELQIVHQAAAARDDPLVTHLDQGRALNDVLQRAIGKLRPGGDEPARHVVPGRQWHQYLVLRDAYVLGELNRDIMGRLYVGEGTFNRTRRRAIRGVARALREMEHEARKRRPLFGAPSE